MFEFKITGKDTKSKARTGILHTFHGNLETPNLAFVGTNGEIKGVPKNSLSKLPVQYMIVNTYHIFTKQILQKVIKQKGIHNFAGYKNIIASDSGGFQVFSMGFGKSHQVGKIGGLFPGKSHENVDKNNPVIIDENGVNFEWNNEKLTLTPEKSIEIQQQIGADIMFAFDECTSPLNSYEYTKEAMERTHRWIHRCIQRSDLSRGRTSHAQQALFAIVQGGYFEDLRKISAKYMGKLEVPGFGIGGSLGKTKEEMLQVLEWTTPYLPENKPRHLLGIGQVRDIFESVERGVDLFDCVIPTREARHKVLYTKHGKIQLRKMKHLNEIIEKDCNCMGCREGITYKQLYEFFLKKDERAFIYSTAHNIQFFSDLMKNIRESINCNNLFELKKEYFKFY